LIYLFLKYDTSAAATAATAATAAATATTAAIISHHTQFY
jgi:hypothetical protein